MEEPIEGVQKYYSDLGYLGRHYLINEKGNPDKKRQYTIVNCLEKLVY
jgi:hypothetical protein